MKKLCTDIMDKLKTLTDLKMVGMWNNQLEWILAGKLELFQHPAAFVAFETADITQLGEGVQLYDPLIITVHILDWQLDAGDGTFEQNLDIFDLKQKVYQTLQKYQPGLTDAEALAGSIIRVAETQDQQHAGIYHFIQTYKTTYVDDSMQEPVNSAGEMDDNMPLEIDLTTQAKQDAAVAYNPAIQYLDQSGVDAKDAVYVKYQDVVYVCKANTPNPAGAFDAQYWTRIEPNIYNFTP